MGTAEPDSSGPARGTSLVGREADLDHLASALSRGSRLVTVLGPPGIGKSRLVRELLLADEKAVWVELAEARTLPDVVRAIADALGCPSTPEISTHRALDVLAGVLQARPATRLVLDSIEPVVGVARLPLQRLAERVSNAQFLVTSSVQLEIACEEVFELGPLPIPDVNERDLDGIERNPAVALFVSRVQRLRPDYAPDASEMSVVAEVVRRLEGAPLSIELAAARMDVISAPQLRDILRSGLGLSLLRSRGPGQERHSSLQVALECSWNLLRPWEQLAVAQCTVFRGGWTLDAAREVLDLSAHHDEGAPRDPLWPIDVMQSLYRKSWIRSSEGQEASSETRFSLFDASREFALARLEEWGGERETWRRHAQYYAAFATNEAKVVYRASHARRLRQEQQNLQAVVERRVGLHPEECADSSVSADLALQCWSGLAAASWASGDLAVDSTDMGRILEGVDVETVDAEVHSTARLSQVCLSIQAAHHKEAWEEAEALHREAPTVRLRAEALGRAVQAHMNAGNFAEAERLGEQTSSLFLSIGDHRGAANVAASLGRLLLQRGRPREAQELLRQAEVVLRAAGDDRGMVHALLARGSALLDEGQAWAAIPVFREAREIGEAMGNRLNTAVATRREAEAHHDLGDLASARALYDAAHASVREVGRLHLVHFFGLYRALIDWETGDLDAAAERLAGAAAILSAKGLEPYAALIGAVETAVTESRRVYAADAIRVDVTGKEPRHLFSDALSAVQARIDVARAGQSASMGRVDETAWSLRLALTRIEAVAPGPNVLVRLLLRPLSHIRDGAGGSSATWEHPVIEAAQAELLQALNVDPREPSCRASDPEARLGITVCHAEHWLQLPGRERIDLSNSRTLWRIIAFLCRLRIHSPGRPASSSELIGAAWPDNPPDPESGKGRLYVAIRRLRKLGLEEIVVSVDGGYVVPASVFLLSVQPTRGD